METFTWLVLRIAAGLFTGGCLYIALVEHPARMQSTTRGALEQFRGSLPRAEKIQPGLLLLCLAMCAWAWALRPEGHLVAGAAVLAFIVPLSVIMLVPINRRLLAGTTDDHIIDGIPLLRRWGALHQLRSVLALAGTTVLFSG